MTQQAKSWPRPRVTQTTLLCGTRPERRPRRLPLALVDLGPARPLDGRPGPARPHCQLATLSQFAARRPRPASCVASGPLNYEPDWLGVTGDRLRHSGAVYPLWQIVSGRYRRARLPVNRSMANCSRVERIEIRIRGVTSARDRRRAGVCRSTRNTHHSPLTSIGPTICPSSDENTATRRLRITFWVSTSARPPRCWVPSILYRPTTTLHGSPRSSIARAWRARARERVTTVLTYRVAGRLNSEECRR